MNLCIAFSEVETKPQSHDILSPFLSKLEGEHGKQVYFILYFMNLCNCQDSHVIHDSLSAPMMMHDKHETNTHSNTSNASLTTNDLIHSTNDEPQPYYVPFSTDFTPTQNHMLSRTSPARSRLLFSSPSIKIKGIHQCRERFGECCSQFPVIQVPQVPFEDGVD